MPRARYKLVTRHGHPRANVRGQVYFHLLVAEKALGEPILLPHVVHHIDEDRFNNEPSNLVICEDDSYHKLLHARKRAYEACGDPAARKCTHCQEYDSLDNLVVANGDGTIYHRQCARNNCNIRYHKRVAERR